MLSRQQCLEKYLTLQTEEYHESLREKVAFDRDVDPANVDQLYMDAHEFMEERCVQQRGEFAPRMQQIQSP